MNNNHLQRLKARRKYWLKVHLYLGLFAGAILTIVGLTGSILVFWQDIDDWLNPSLHRVAAQARGEADFVAIDRIMMAATEAMPPGAQSTFAYYPNNNSAAYQFFFSAPNATSNGVDEYLVFVNPYTADVTGIKLVKSANDWLPQAFMPFVFQLHYSLLLGEKGSTLVGIISAMLIISVLTGLIVWWPLTGKWKQVLTIKFKTSKERLNYDLHKTVGIFSTLLLLALLISGIEFNLPEQFHTLVQVFSPVTNRNEIKSRPANGRVAIPLTTALGIVNARYPEGRLDWVYNATEPDSVFTFCKREVKLNSRFIDRRCVVVDQYSGDILWVQEPNTGSAGDLFIQWLWPIHSGQAFGLSGRILIFITGLMCPILFITGVIRWLQKYRAKKRCI